jgi:hypothetical protein
VFALTFALAAIEQTLSATLGCRAVRADVQRAIGELDEQAFHLQAP